MEASIEGGALNNEHERLRVGGEVCVLRGCS